MKLFQQRELKDAYLHAELGEQALHLCKSAQFVTENAPQVFKRSTEFAHLIDYDLDRLVRTAKRLGVRVIKVGRLGRAGQHIDLCNKPLARAIAECATPELALQ